MQRSSCLACQQENGRMQRIFIIGCFCLFLACKKSKTDVALIGKWKIIESYSGGPMGACNCWTVVPSTYAETIEFDVLGHYTIKPPLLSSQSRCSGRYQVVDSSTLKMTSSCLADPDLEMTHQYSLDGNILIIHFWIFEGEIRRKYIKE
jgi:hypothetical protein